MNELVRFGERLFGWVLQTSWQAGILAVLILATQAIFRRRLSPAWRYGLWLLLVARLLLPHTPQTSWSIYNFARLPVTLNKEVAPSRGEGPKFQVFPPASPLQHDGDSGPTISSVQRKPRAPSNRLSIPNGPSTGQTKLFWSRLALFTWIVGVWIFATRLIWSNFRFSNRINDLSNVTSGPALLLLAACQEKLGISRPVTLIETNAVQSPSVHGFWRKRMLLPEGTLQRFSTNELRCIFLHELAHIKRRDLEVNWLSSLLLVVHWFNPLLWLAFVRMRYDREIACDAVALTNLGESLAEPYGETIIRVVGNLVNPPRSPGVLALSEDGERLKERIKMIARFRPWPRWSALALVLASGIAAVGLTNASRARPATAPIEESLIRRASPDRDPAALPRGIHARVVDFHGDPVTNASVVCQEFGWRANTDSEGRFSWKGEKKSRTFQITKSGYKTLLTDQLIPGESETVLKMQHAPTMAGKVIDMDTRQPISAFQVYPVRVLHGPVTPSLSPHDVVTGSSGAFKYSFAHFFWPDDAFYIEAEGYRPVLSRPLNGSDDGKELLFELTRSQPLGGRVLTPQGTPADTAQIRLWCGEPNLTDIPRQHETASDKDGAFTVPVILDGRILVYNSSGYAEVPWKDFLVKNSIQLSEWGHVKGHWPEPLPKNRKVSLERINWSGRMNRYTSPLPWTLSDAYVNLGGGFEFAEGIPPGEYVLTERNSLRLNWPEGGFSMALLNSERLPVLVEAGRTTVVEVPAGRSVLGKIGAGDEQSLTNVHLPIVSLRLKQKETDLKFPPLDPSLSDAENFDRWQEYRRLVLDYWLSDEGMAKRRAARIFEVSTEQDGTFRIDNVTPGLYELQINAQRWSPKSGPEIHREFSISASADGTPVDLGTLR